MYLWMTQRGGTGYSSRICWRKRRKPNNFSAHLYSIGEHFWSLNVRYYFSIFLYLPGGIPAYFLKNKLKWYWLRNLSFSLTSARVNPEFIRCSAYLIFCSIIYSDGEIFSCVLKSLKSCLVLKWQYSATSDTFMPFAKLSFIYCLAKEIW